MCKKILHENKKGKMMTDDIHHRFVIMISWNQTCVFSQKNEKELNRQTTSKAIHLLLIFIHFDDQWFVCNLVKYYRRQCDVRIRFESSFFLNFCIIYGNVLFTIHRRNTLTTTATATTLTSKCILYTGCMACLPYIWIDPYLLYYSFM